nr:cytochrome c [uncultured Flavobacterium sp.]
MKKLKTVCLALILASAVISCSSGGDDSPTPPVVTPPTSGGGSGTVTNPTYTANIKSIIDGNCVSCHSAGGQNSAVPLQTYAQVSGKSSLIKTRIEKPAGDPLVMPKGGKLSQANIDLINKWITDGMPN